MHIDVNFEFIPSDGVSGLTDAQGGSGVIGIANRGILWTSMETTHRYFMMVVVSTIFGNIHLVPSGDANVTNYNLISNPSRDDIIANPENYL